MASLVLVYNITVSGFTLTLPITTGTIISINWGDGITNASTSHTYATSNTYTVSISGTGITSFAYYPGTGQQYLIQCTSFGTIGLTDLSYMFYSAINLTVVPSTLPPNVTNMGGMFEGAILFNQNIGSWVVTSVTDMSYMFSDATAFNQNIGTWDTTNVTNMSTMFQGATAFNQNIGGWVTSSVTNMSSMFRSATAFNQNISGWSTANVTDMSNMFQNATSFNENIGGWSTSSVTNMSSMFSGTTSFNQNIGTWNVSNVQYMDEMLNNSGLSTTNYNALLNGWAAQTVQSSVTLGAQGLTYSSAGLTGRNTLINDDNWIITGDTFLPDPPPPQCFKEGSKILTDTGYKAIETLRKGDLVKTLKHGYKPIVMIGKRDIYNPAQKDRIKDQLYKCSQDKYPELIEPLIITGCHSILVDNLVTHKKIEEIKKVLGGVYFTDDKLRMPACLDEKASVYEVKGDFTIYHIALENDDYYMNYGVYANGLLVETCSKRYLKELSNMVLF
jgi:surface protein